MKFRFAIFFLVVSLASPPARTESYQELELTSRNLVLPETEQFKLGAKLFAEKDKRLAAWKAFQTFLFKYPESPQAGDAQFMLAESIFQQAVKEYLSGNPPDEAGWKKHNKGGLKLMGKGLKKGLEGLKNLGSTISGEAGTPQEMEAIDVATFSEAIEQFKKVADDYKKAGLSD